MILEEKRDRISIGILSIVIISSNFLSATTATAIYLMLASICLIYLNNKTTFGYLKIVYPLIGIIMVGLAGVFWNEQHDIARDVIYSLSPVALIFLGHWLAGRSINWVDILKSMIIISILLALIHLYTFVINPELIDADMNIVTRESHPSGGLVVLSVVLGLLQNRLGLGNLFPRYMPRSIALIILIASFVLSYSRTEILISIILSMALLGYLHHISIRLVFISLAAVAAFFLFSNRQIDGEDFTFISKILRSMEEISISDYTDYEDINKNWRGFETQSVITTYLSGRELQLVFGQGFGALVNLGMTMTLGGADYDKIPIVHNGYAYILIKTGVVGVLLYILFYLKLIRVAIVQSNSDNEVTRFHAVLLLGVVLCLLITMYVVGGPPEGQSSEFVLLTGYLAKRVNTWRDSNVNMPLRE